MLSQTIHTTQVGGITVFLKLACYNMNYYAVCDYSSAQPKLWHVSGWVARWLLAAVFVSTISRKLQRDGVSEFVYEKHVV